MKMQISWGWKIAAVYTGFVLMIITLVVMSMTRKIDLVADDYYAQELAYQEKMDKIRRAAALEEPLKWNIAGEAVKIIFPAGFDGQEITGEVYFYCPSDNRKDRIIPLEVSEGMWQVIPLSLLSSGRYRMQIDWKVNNMSYWSEGVINI